MWHTKIGESESERIQDSSCDRTFQKRSFLNKSKRKLEYFEQNNREQNQSAYNREKKWNKTKIIHTSQSARINTIPFIWLLVAVSCLLLAVVVAIFLYFIAGK